MASDVHLRVPGRHRASFTELGSWSNEAFETVAVAFESAPRTFNETDLAASVADALKAAGAADVGTTLDALLSLRSYISNHHSTIDVAASTVAEQMARDLDADGEDLRVRVDRLLRTDAVTFVAKAMSLGLEAERIFHTCRVVSDLRPVFGNDRHELPIGMMVLHSLRIDFFQDQQIASVYLNLSDEDLETLKGEIDQAYAKRISLGSLADSLGLGVHNRGQL